jgi:hypothetical protein
MTLIKGADLVSMFGAMAKLGALADWLPLHDRLIAIRQRVAAELPETELRAELMAVLDEVILVAEKQQRP